MGCSKEIAIIVCSVRLRAARVHRILKTEGSFMSIDKIKLAIEQIVKGCLFLIIAVYAQLFGTVNAQSWATPEYVQKKRIEVEGRIRDYGRMLVNGDDRDWKHLKEGYLKQLPSITSDDEYNSVMDRLAKQEWQSIRLNSTKVDCDYIPNLKCETFVYKLLAGVIAPYVNEGKTWQAAQEFYLASLQKQEEEKNRRTALAEELRKEKAEWEIKEKERIAHNEEFEAKSRAEREAKEKAEDKVLAEKLAKMLAEEAEETKRAEKKRTEAAVVIKEMASSVSCSNLCATAIRALDDITRLAKYRDLYNSKSPNEIREGIDAEIEKIYPEYGALKGRLTKRLSLGAMTSYSEGVEYQECMDCVALWRRMVGEKVMRAFY